MLTLHLSDYQDRFAIWADTASGRGDAGVDYPYQADYDQLLAALAAIGFQRPAELPVETVWIWTPALDGRVLLPGQAGMGEGLSLAPRELRVLLPEPAQVLEWLLSPVMPDAPREGSELAVWRALLQLAASLLALTRCSFSLVFSMYCCSRSRLRRSASCALARPSVRRSRNSS